MLFLKLVSHDIFFRLSLWPFEVVEIEFWSIFFKKFQPTLKSCLLALKRQDKRFLKFWFISLCYFSSFTVLLQVLWKEMLQNWTNQNFKNRCYTKVCLAFSMLVANVSESAENIFKNSIKNSTLNVVQLQGPQKAQVTIKKMSWDSPIFPKDAKNSIGCFGQFLGGYSRVLGDSALRRVEFTLKSYFNEQIRFYFWATQ